MKIKSHGSPKKIGHSDSVRSPTSTSTRNPTNGKPVSSPPSRTDSFSSGNPASRPAANPHLANPADVGTLRPQIAQQAQNNPSFYGRLVGMVNGGLHQTGFGISPASHQSVMNNLQQVHSGNMSQGTAHFLEAGSFAQDALNSFRHGRPLQGAVESTGVLLNSVGGVGMSALQGFGRISHGPTPSEQSGNDPW